MQVYIEYVIIDNLVVNSLIITLTCLMLKVEATKLKVFLIAMLGTVFAIFMPFIILPGYLLMIVKMLIGLSIVSLLKKYKGITDFVLTFLVFLSLTFVMGGVCFGLMFLTSSKIMNGGALIYESQVPVGVILLIINIYSYLMINLIKSFYKKKMINNFLFKVSICNKAIECRTNAFLDTGNRLVNKDNNKPIVVINYRVFNELFNGVNLTDILLSKLDNLPLKKVGYMYIEGVAGKKSKMLIFEVDKLKIFLDKQVNIIENVTLGLTLNKFKDELNYNVLLNPLLFDF